MKISSQVYVRNSLEAVEAYCRAFGAEITFAVKNGAQDGYEHCELSVDGRLFMAVSETPDGCDLSKKKNWQTMAFNVYEMGSEEAVRRAYDVLREGGTVVEELGPVPWSSLCCDIIDKYGVFWWISI